MEHAVQHSELTGRSPEIRFIWETRWPTVQQRKSNLNHVNDWIRKTIPTSALWMFDHDLLLKYRFAVFDDRLVKEKGAFQLTRCDWRPWRSISGETQRGLSCYWHWRGLACYRSPSKNSLQFLRKRTTEVEMDRNPRNVITMTFTACNVTNFRVTLTKRRNQVRFG